ncbi:protein NRT1/ PTR FAMILY 5.4-like [Corylus avellana]|uniref:protein NRT1/ PTR FAMILY 5.4-like n=1 Tax=Corylus avellana TaxID=13451 RepID=UPI001E216521|nr:protein NRT1/ PTR FAMILY 5.4-like [Corylus avellana]
MIDEGSLENSKECFTQRKPSTGGWNAAIFIIFVEVAERFAFCGLASNLITYLTDDLHEPTSTAVKIVNTWVGVSYLFPVLGAFAADSFLGRFRTILVASIIYCTGFVLLTLSVSVLPLHDRKAIFFVALYIIAVGEGGHKPCVQTFAADQFNENLPEEKKAKSSFFNWWYSGIMVGATSSTLAVVYIEDNISWAAGFGVLATALAASLAIFLLGIKRYKKQGPFGSPFTSVAQVVAAAARKWRVDETGRVWGVCCGDVRIGVHEDGQPKSRTLAHTDQLRFLDKATIIDNIDASSQSRNPWRLCSQNQVEEVKLVLCLIPVWLCSLMFAVVATNFQTYFTKQGSTMIRSVGRFQLPAASLQALLGLTVMIAIPIYDRIFVPITRRFTGHLSGITLLQRIGIGLFLSLINMAVSALVEAKRVGVAKEHNLLDNPKATVPMSVWWLLPQYIFCGLSDVFTFIGLQELFYDQMPESMRSLGAAAYVTVVGVGSFVSSAVISIVQVMSSSFGEEWLGDNLNRAHLDGFYWVLAGLSALNLCVYVWVAKRFVYKKVEGDDDDDDDILA